MRLPTKGDLLIRHSAAGFELIDEASRQLVATTASLNAAIEVAATREGALWRQDADNRGRALGDPVQLLPPRSGRQYTNSAA